MLDRGATDIRARLSTTCGGCLHAHKEHLWTPAKMQKELCRADSHQWLEAMRLEIAGIIAQDVYELQDLPKGPPKISSVYVYS
jgi:hypothetical protein